PEPCRALQELAGKAGARAVGVEVEVVDRRGRRVELAGDVSARSVGDRLDDGEVLQLIRARVRVERVVRRDAATAITGLPEIDAESLIAEDRIHADDVLDVARVVPDLDTAAAIEGIGAVERDDVGHSDPAAADDVAAAPEQHSAQRIAQWIR